MDVSHPPDDVDPDRYLSFITWPDIPDESARYGFFGSACCRRIWSLLPQDSRRAVEIREEYDCGNATLADCEEAIAIARRSRSVERQKFWGKVNDGEFTPQSAPAWAAGAAYNACVGNWVAASKLAAYAFACVNGGLDPAYHQERLAQCSLFAELNAERVMRETH